MRTFQARQQPVAGKIVAPGTAHHIPEPYSLWRVFAPPSPWQDVRRGLPSPTGEDSYLRLTQ